MVSSTNHSQNDTTENKVNKENMMTPDNADETGDTHVLPDPDDIPNQPMLNQPGNIDSVDNINKILSITNDNHFNIGNEVDITGSKSMQTTSTNNPKEGRKNSQMVNATNTSNLNQDECADFTESTFDEQLEEGMNSDA